MVKMESLFLHLPYDIFIFTNKCHQNVTGQLCQDELKGPMRASQDVYPLQEYDHVPHH